MEFILPKKSHHALGIRRVICLISSVESEIQFIGPPSIFRVSLHGTRVLTWQLICVGVFARIHYESYHFICCLSGKKGVCCSAMLICPRRIFVCVDSTVTHRTSFDVTAANLPARPINQ